jgi:hypothetical protein
MHSCTRAVMHACIAEAAQPHAHPPAHHTHTHAAAVCVAHAVNRQQDRVVDVAELGPRCPVGTGARARALLWWLLWWLCSRRRRHTCGKLPRSAQRTCAQRADWSLHGLLADSESASCADDVSTQELLRAPSLKTPPPNATLAYTTNLPTPAFPPPPHDPHTHTHTQARSSTRPLPAWACPGQGVAGTGQHHHTHVTGVTDTRL